MSGGTDRRLRSRVCRRANDQCEYCCYPQRACYAAFHCDHCIPESRGGMTEYDNLAWACPSCNASKGDRISEEDPKTGQVVLLFNPRSDHWNDHFVWSPDRLRIYGKTPKGRATVHLLRMNRQQARLIRDLLLQVGLHPAN